MIHKKTLAKSTMIKAIDEDEEVKNYMQNSFARMIQMTKEETSNRRLYQSAYDEGYQDAIERVKVIIDPYFNKRNNK
jgi:hypothetical protein